MEARVPSKRPRIIPTNVNHVLHFARLIMEKDPFKHKAPKEENANFRALFGCSPDVVLILWYRLQKYDYLPENGTLMHLLWTLMYTYTYPKWKTMRQLTNGTDMKTLRKWIGEFRTAICYLEPFIVSTKSFLCLNSF